MSTEDLPLLRLFVLLRAANGRVSEQSIIAEFERRKIGGVAAPIVRRLLRSLAGKKLIRQIKGSAAVFEATSPGRKAASEAGPRLSALRRLLNDERSPK